MKLNHIISEYYRNTLFVFLPNICNSACDFCYVQPLVGKSAILSNSTLDNFRTLVNQASEIGIDCIRITGGEPLIFSNFAEIISILKSAKMGYTLLSNGQKLFKYIDLFKDYPPSKIGVSIHSLVNYEKIFKSTINHAELLAALSELKLVGTEVSVTIVYLKENQSEVPGIISFFEEREFDEIKVIFPNTKDLNHGLLNDFKLETFKSKNIKVRHTDLFEKKCLLYERGFASIVVESLELYNCCTTVGESNNLTPNGDEFDLSKLLKVQFDSREQIKDYPCNTFIEACPIALRPN